MRPALVGWPGSDAFLATAQGQHLFDLFNEAGQNTLRAATKLNDMMAAWPDDNGLGREILIIEQEVTGSPTTSSTGSIRPSSRRLTARTFTASRPSSTTWSITSRKRRISCAVPDRSADGPGPDLTRILVGCCEQLSLGLENLPSFRDLDQYWIEIHRLENDGDRVSRDAVASLFSNGIDPMVVIRWKDIFAVLEKAIDKRNLRPHP